MSQDQLPPLYRYIPVWTRSNDQLSLYRVVEIIGVGFVVQSRDFLSHDASPDQVLQRERQFLELLSELPPEQRAEPRATVQAAIADFNTKFQDGT